VDFWISQLFNGVSYGALLFLLAGGLSLIFGMMRIVNMTHGSYYLLGGYVALFDFVIINFIHYFTRFH